MGLLGTKAFYVPHLLITRNRLLSASKTSTKFQQEVQTVANQEREGDAKTGDEQYRNNSAASGKVPEGRFLKGYTK